MSPGRSRGSSVDVGLPTRAIPVTPGGASDAFRAFNFERIYLRPAACRQAEKVVGLLKGLVDFFLDAPIRLPADATGMHEGLIAGSPETAAVVVRYVSGMTDRYALGLGVELLGWRAEHLPRGV